MHTQSRPSSVRAAAHLASSMQRMRPKPQKTAPSCERSPLLPRKTPSARQPKNQPRTTMSKNVDDAIRSKLLAFVIKAFAQLYPGNELVLHPYVKFLACYLEAVATGEMRRLVITLPPRRLKTFLASICLA